MPIYAWRGRNNLGELIQGELEAMSDDAVADQLLSLGLVPVQIQAASDAPSSESWWDHLKRRAIAIEDVLIFSRQMYTLNKAGVPILRAFSGLEASAEKPAMVDVLKDVRSSLDQGRDMATSLARHPKVFGPFYVAMIRVGEMTGRLTEVFLRLAEHLEFERDV
ncbi:MAG: type II secretion system F family protein, partial [Hylemonella sp.]